MLLPGFFVIIALIYFLIFLIKKPRFLVGKKKYIALFSLSLICFVIIGGLEAEFFYKEHKELLKWFVLYCSLLAIMLWLYRRMVKSNAQEALITPVLISIFTYLVFISQAVYFLFDSNVENEFVILTSSSDKIFFFCKYMIRSLHFAADTMTSGMLFDQNSRANCIIDSLNIIGYKTPAFKSLTTILIGFAPFSTAVWLVLAIKTDIVTYVKMLFNSIVFRKTLVVLNCNDISLCAAEAVYDNWSGSNNKDINIVFCRCDSSIQNTSADSFSRISAIEGIPFKKTELEFPFKPNKTYYLICAKNYNELNNYASLMNQDNERFKNKYVIYDAIESDIRLILHSGDVERVEGEDDYKVYSTYDEICLTDIGRFNNKDVILIMGKGKIKYSVISACRRTGFEGTSQLQGECLIVMFPSTIEEYSELREYRNDNVVIRNPEDYANNNIIDDLYQFLHKYYPEKKRTVFLVSENIEENIRIKHLLYEWIKKDLDTLDIEFKIFCNDKVVRNIEKAWDDGKNSTAQKFQYLGETSEVINSICKKIVEDMNK